MLTIKKVSRIPMSGKMGTLRDLNQEDISRILGFRPVDTSKTTDGKTTVEWRFEIEGNMCAIWDWKGSAALKEWSWSGNRNLMALVFGDHLT